MGSPTKPGTAEYVAYVDLLNYPSSPEEEIQSDLPTCNIWESAVEETGIRNQSDNEG